MNRTHGEHIYQSALPALGHLMYANDWEHMMAAYAFGHIHMAMAEDADDERAGRLGAPEEYVCRACNGFGWNDYPFGPQDCVACDGKGVEPAYARPLHVHVKLPDNDPIKQAFQDGYDSARVDEEKLDALCTTYPI
jgi:hypothetical protein